MGQRLLIVDSDRRFIKDHQVALEAAFEVDFVNGTESVPAKLSNGNYAAALICVEVSENKGYALCSILRRMPELASIKIGLISTKATEEEYARHRSLKGRAADLYLRKPIDSGTLVTELSALAPMKTVDQDNPLGDLTGTDLGDEWLDSLKSELGEDASPLQQAPVFFVPPATPSAVLPPSVPLPVQAALQMDLTESEGRNYADGANRSHTPQVEVSPQGQAIFSQQTHLDAMIQNYMAMPPVVIPQPKVDIPFRPAQNLIMEAQIVDSPRIVSPAALDRNPELEKLETLVWELREKLQAKEDQCLALENRTRIAEEESRELEDRCTALERKVANEDAMVNHTLPNLELEHCIVQLKEEKAALEARIQDLEGSQGRTEKRLDDLLLARDAAERNASEVREEKAEAERRIAALMGEKETSERSVAELKAEKDRAERNVAALRAEKDAEESRLTALLAEKLELEKKLSSASGEFERVKEIQRLDEEHLSRIRELEEDRSAMLGKVEAIQSHLDAKSAEVAERVKEVDALKVDIAGLEATLRGQRRELADQSARILAITRECDSYQSSVKEHQQKLQDLESALSSKAEALAKREAEVKDLRELRTNLEERLAQTQKDLQDAKLGFAKRMESTLAEKESQLKSTVADYEGRLDATKRQLETELENRVNDYESRLAAEKADHEATLQGKITEYETRIASTLVDNEKALLELLQEVEDRESRIRRLNVDLESYRTGNQELEHAKKSMEGDLNEKTARLEALASAVADLEISIRRATDLTRPF